VRVIPVFLLVLAVLTGHAQRIIPRFETLGVNDGLPHSSVYGIKQDKKGFMWFSTPDGLCRYDGSVLRTFRYIAKSDSDVVNNFIRGDFFEDGSGNIWYSNESGIYKWNVLTEVIEKVRSFAKKEFGASSFQCMYMDAKDKLVILNIIKGIFEFNTITRSLIRYPIPFKINYSQVLFTQSNADDKGNIWLRLLSKNEPYIFFDAKTHLYSIKLSNNPPQSVFFERGRRILAYNDKLVIEDEKKGQVMIKKMVNNKPVNFYSVKHIRDQYHREWLTSRGNGLFYYDEAQGTFQNYYHNNSKLKSLPFDITTCLFIDNGSNLWIGIDGAGVAKLDLKEPMFNLFPLSEGDYPVLKDYFIKCFYEDDDGNIWFGTHSSGLNIYNPKTGRLINYQHKKGDKASLPGNIVSNIFKDKDGNMWIGNSGGLSIFDQAKRAFKTISIAGLPTIFPDLNVFTYKIIQLRNGDLLAATLIGLVRVTRDARGNFKASYFRGDAYLLGCSVDVVEMPDGDIYIASSGNGLYHFVKVNGVYTQRTAYLPGIDLRSLRIDEQDPDWLWIGSGKGLIHFNTQTKNYQVWDEKDKMPNAYVYGALEDEKHNLWISTNKGLCYFDRAKKTFDSYSFLDGLQSNEFNTQSFYKSKTGNFYFGGIKGFNWFKPVTSNKPKIKPLAAITRVEIDGEQYQKTKAYFTDEDIIIPYHKNAINFEFAVLDYTRPEANRVQYILQNWETKPVITYSRSVRYTHLQPGNYVFKIKAANIYGVWSEEQRVYLHIKSPFWRQSWFYICASVLLLAVIIYATYQLSQIKTKRRLRELEHAQAINAERNRISRDMHDEIGSGLTRIALLSELIQTHHAIETTIKSEVNNISAAARKLLESINEIIWALNPQNDTLESLLAYTREQMHQHFQPFKLELKIAFQDVVPVIRLTNEQRRNLYLVTKEALNNVLKHSGARSVGLSCAIAGNHISFMVKDDGIGLTHRQQKVASNGLINMRKRMQDIGGEIDFVDEGNGLTVSYHLIVDSY
jgi:signal transduction histidine kinase/ligand-binding sensor domain-containing protein